MIDDFTKCNNNNFIILLIINIGAKFATHMKESFIICCYQADKYDHPDLGNINYVSEDVISLWQEIIRHSGQKAKKDIDIDYIQNKSNSSYYHNSLIRIFEPMIDKIEILEEYLTKLEYN